MPSADHGKPQRPASLRRTTSVRGLATPLLPVRCRSHSIDTLQYINVFLSLFLAYLGNISALMNSAVYHVVCFGQLEYIDIPDTSLGHWSTLSSVLPAAAATLPLATPGPSSVANQSIRTNTVIQHPFTLLSLWLLVACPGKNSV